MNTRKKLEEFSALLMNNIEDSYNKHYKVWKELVMRTDDIFDKDSTRILGLQNVLAWINKNILNRKDKFLEYYLQPDTKMYFEMMLELDDFVLRLYSYLSSSIATRLDNPYVAYLDNLTIERLKDILFNPIDIVLYKKAHGLLKENTVKEIFTKDRISFQTTVVKFRNGKLGIAISDKTSKDDHDGTESFIIYNPETKEFEDYINIHSYDDNLINKCSKQGLINALSGFIDKPTEVYKPIFNDIGDTNYDIIAVQPCIYAIDAFRFLTKSESEQFWFYRRNEETNELESW